MTEQATIWQAVPCPCPCHSDRRYIHSVRSILGSACSCGIEGRILATEGTQGELFATATEGPQS